MRTNGMTDSHDEANIAFRNFANALKTKGGWLSLSLRVLLTPTNATFFMAFSYTECYHAVRSKTRQKMDTVY